MISAPWRSRLRWSIVAIVGFMLAFPPIYAAVAPDPFPVARPLPVPPERAYRVFVADWGYHTAIIVEQPEGLRLGPPGEEDAPFLEYAWGDRRFYYESRMWPHSVFATLFLPTDAVLYLDGRSDPPPLRGAEAVFTRTVHATTVRALLAELERSFRRSPDGARLPALPRTPGYAGRFYPAYGEYLWAHDCNWWTVARLRDAGLAGSAAGVVVTTQVPGRLHGFSPLERRH